MPTTPTPPPRRYRQVVETLFPTDEFRGGVTPDRVAAELDVTPQTARRQLRALSDLDELDRFLRPTGGGGIAYCPADELSFRAP